MAASSSSSQNVELEAAKFLQKLIQESKDEPAKLATKLFVILQHMKSSGKEHSMPYQVISRAMETVINQHGLDIEALKSSRLPLSGPQVGDSSTLKQSDSLPAAALHTKLGVGEQEMSKSNPFASGKALVGPSSVSHEYYQGSGSLTNRSNQSFDQESPSSVDTRSANSQSQERRDAANYGKSGSQKDSRKTEPKRKRGDPSVVSEPHVGNPQKGEPGNNLPYTRKGKMNKVDTAGPAFRGVEQTNFNIVQSAGPMEHLPSSLLSRVKQEDQMQRVASYDSRGLVSKMHEQRTMETYGIASTPLEHSLNRGATHIPSTRGDDASVMLASESSVEHDRGRLSMITNEGRNPAVAESGVLRHPNMRDTGKSIVLRASAAPGTPFKEQQLKQLRAQCLVFLAFRNEMPPKPSHLEIALGNILQEGTNMSGLWQEPLDQKGTAQPSNEPSKVPNSVLLFGRLNMGRETDRSLAGFSAGGSISSSHLQAVEAKDPRLLENRSSGPSNLTMPPEEMKGLVGAHGLEVHVQNQTAEPLAYPSAIMDVAGNGVSNLGKDHLQVLKANLASSPIMNQKMKAEIVNQTGFGEAPGGSMVSSTLRDNWKPVSGSNSKHQVVTGMDSHMVTARDAVHVVDKSAEENVEDGSASVSLPPPKYTMLDKWAMDQQKKRLMVEQNQLLKQHRAEQKIAACFDGLKKNVSSSEDLSAKTKSVIELKKLQLLALQRRLRSDFLEDFFKPTATGMEHLRSFKKHRHGRRVKQIEKYEQKMKEERFKRIRERQKEFFSDIELHKERLEEVFKVKRERLKGFNKYVKELHKRKERIHREKIDRIQREKITLLKINDVEGYLRMVQDAKSDRVKQLLKETEKYLQKLGSKLKEAKSAASRFERDGDEMQPATDLDNIDTVIENEDESDQAKHYKESNEKYYLMAHSVKESIAEQPAMLHGGKLREYQMNGLRWLVSLYNNHLNGILADEMGLGKTVQVISLICYLMETKNDRGPFLVVVPSSVLPGWENEINFWAPAIHKIVYAGPPEERRRLFKEKIVQQKFNVLLTTYEYMMNKHDRPKLSKVHWHYIIIDEGHRIKNASCKLNAELKHYRSSHRLLLTGTPLQNSLEELWALLNFLLPNIFNSSEDFSQWFNKPFQSNGDTSVEEALLSEEENLLIINRLHQVLRPFVLRRLKHKVENELPEKIERLIRCEASAYQKLLMKRVDDNLGSLGNPKARSVQNSVMELRNICNHPYLSQLHSEEIDNLIPKHYLPPIIRLCGKLEMLDRLLPKLKATDHRVLFFSTMTRLLDVMEEYLNWKHYRYLRLDGHTSGGDRGALINQFNNPNSPYFIFLLSIRAGGVGVNLQAADTVILFDTDWNPQVDLQAQARAHRIGQKKDVLVLRFETVQTVEEQVRAAAEHKLGVANQSITAGFFDNNTSAEDRREYLESLLRECKKEEAAPVLDDDTLNDVIARKESEIEIFESIDRQRREEEMAAWTKLVTGQGKDATKLFPPLPSRLVTDDDLKAFCEAMKIFETPKVTASSAVGVKRKSGYVDTQQYGRGKRTREVRSYEEQMTEEEFEKMCQVEAPDSPGHESEGVKTQLVTEATSGSSESTGSILPTSPTAVALPVAKTEEATPMPQIAEATPMLQTAEVKPMPQTAEATPMPQSSQVTPPVKRGRGRPKRVVSSTSPAIQPPSGTPKMKIEPQVATSGVNIFPSPTAKGSTEISTDQVSEMKSTPEAKPPLAPPAVYSQSPALTQERGRRRKTNRAEVLKGSSSMGSPTSGSQSVSVAPPFLSQEKGQMQNIPSRAEACQGIIPATVDIIPNSQLSSAVVPASIGSQTCSVDPPVLVQEKSLVLAQEQPPVLAKKEPSIVLQEQPSPLMPEKGQRRKTQVQTEAPRRRGRKRKSEYETGSDGMAGQDFKLNEQLQKQSANLVGVQASSVSVSVPSCGIVPAVNPCPETADAVIRGKEEEASQGLIDENRERVCGLPVQEPKSGGSDNLSKGKQPASSKIGSNVRYVASMMKEILSASKTKVGERLEGEVRDSPSLPVHNSIFSEVTGGNPEERTLSVNSVVETAYVTRPAGSQEIQSGGGVAVSAGGNERRTRRTTRNMAKKFTEENLEEMPALPPGFETLKKAEFSGSGTADATTLPPSDIANSVTVNQTVITPHSGILASNLTTSEGGKEPIKAASCILDQSVNAKTDDSKTESANTVGPAELVTESEKMPNDNLITESEREALEADVQIVEVNKVKHEDHNVVVECQVEETALKQDSSDEPFKEKLSDICVNTITNPEGDITKKCQQELNTKGADIGETLHSKNCSSELQAPPSSHVLDELPVKTDLSVDKGAANSQSEVAELGGSKEEMSDQICDSHTSVSFSNYMEPLPSSPAVEENLEASHGVNVDDSLALQEAAQVEVAQQSDGLNLYLDYLAAAEEKTKDSEGGVNGQVGISEVNPETVDEACEVKNEPISAADSAVMKESECFLSGDDLLEKTNLETIRDDEAEKEKKMAPTHDSVASTEPKAAVFRSDSVDEINAETARSDHASVEDQVNAIPVMVTERAYNTVLQGFGLGCDSAKPETAQPDDAVQDTRENERSDQVTDDAAESGFDFGSDHINLEIALTDNEPQENVGPHEVTEKVHHTTLRRFDSGSDQVIQDPPTTDAIQEIQGNAVPDLVPKESHQNALPGVDSGSNPVEAEASPTDRATEEPQEIARMKQVPEKPHHIALQEVDLGCDLVQQETSQDDPAMEELHGNAHHVQVAGKVDLTVSPGVNSDSPADHTIEEPQENADLEVPEKARHSEQHVVDSGSDHVEQPTSPIDHAVLEPQANAGLDEVPHVDHDTILSGMDSGHEQVLADTCPPDDTLQEPLQRASPEQVPEKIHHDVLPAVCLEFDHVNAETAPTNSTVEVLPGVYTGPDQDKSETIPTNHAVKEPQGNSGPDHVPTILERLDSGSNQVKPETCPIGHAIVQLAIGNTCPDQGLKFDIPEVSESTKEPSALLDDSTDVEMDSVVLGGDAQDEVKQETAPTNDAVEEPQETAAPFQVTQEAHGIILAVDELGSDSSKVCEPEEQIAEADAAVAEQLNSALLRDSLEDEVCPTTSNSQIEPESVSEFSENVEQLAVPEDFAGVRESTSNSHDEAKLESVIEAYETVQQQSSPTHDSIVTGESKSLAGVSEIMELQSTPADDSTIAGESKAIGKISETLEQQSIPADDSTIVGESKPVGEVSEILEEQQSVPADDSTIAEESLKPVGEDSETLEQQSVPADHSTISETSETRGQWSIPADDSTITEEPLKPVGEVSETLGQQRIPEDDSTNAGEQKPIGEASETPEQLSIPADDSSIAGESKPVDKVSDTLEQQSVPADDSDGAKELKHVEEISDTLEQEPLPETDDSAGAGESEPVVQVSETIQQEPIPEADDSAGAGESEPVVEVSETIQQEAIPEADDSAAAGESKPVAEVSETLAQESLQEVDNSAGSGESKPVAEVSETLAQEPLPEADNSADAEQSKPVEDVFETLEQESLLEADDSAVAGELGPIVEVSETLQHEPLPEADDSTAAGESK